MFHWFTQTHTHSLNFPSKIVINEHEKDVSFILSSALWNRQRKKRTHFTIIINLILLETWYARRSLYSYIVSNNNPKALTANEEHFEIVFPFCQKPRISTDKNCIYVRMGVCVCIGTMFTIIEMKIIMKSTANNSSV